LFEKSLFQLCFVTRHQEGPGEPGGTDTEWDTSAGGWLQHWKLAVTDRDSRSKKQEKYLIKVRQ
jgi:hypothetical protein